MFLDETLFDGVSFNVDSSDKIGFVGINGAGKSTLFKIINGEMDYDSGEIFKSKGLKIGYLEQYACADSQNTIWEEMLTVFDEVISIEQELEDIRFDIENKTSDLEQLINRQNTLQERFSELEGFYYKSKIKGVLLGLGFSEEEFSLEVGKLSGGQRRRIDIARALLHEPKILILDEPTTGLDPQTRSLLWKTVEDLRHETGMTVFLTTHYMEEAADADYVVILDSGKIVAEGTPLELKNKYTDDFITIYNVSEAEIKPLGREYTELRDAYRVSVPDTAAATELIIKYPSVFKDYEITKGKMDDVFMAVTGKTLTGGSNNE